MKTVEIHYLRLPERPAVFRQSLVEQTARCTVTLMERTPLAAPVLAGGRVILEPDAPVVWFTFPGAWHDIGRFHTVRGEFTGCYANILTPVQFRSRLEWETTDLCLDVWRSATGHVELLDEDEFEEAIARGWIDGPTAFAARREAEALLDAARAAAWPPAIVGEWTLERARAAAGHPAP